MIVNFICTFLLQNYFFSGEQTRFRLVFSLLFAVWCGYLQSEMAFSSFRPWKPLHRVALE